MRVWGIISFSVLSLIFNSGICSQGSIHRATPRSVPPFPFPLSAPGELPGEVIQTDTGKTCRIPPKRRLRIVVIDGGGARGIIPSIVAAELEKQLDLPITKIMDAFGGTSVGGIEILGYNVPENIRKEHVGSLPKYSAQVVSDVVRDLGPHIFDAKKLSKVKNVVKRGARYKATKLEEVLEKFFGDVLISQTIKPVFVTTLDLTTNTPFLITTSLAKKGSTQPIPQMIPLMASDESLDSVKDVRKKSSPLLNLSMQEAARATSAAPTYFPVLPLTIDHLGTKLQLTDGGVGLNNPSHVVLREIDKEYCDEYPAVLFISLGTGESKVDYGDLTKKRKGPARMISPAISGYAGTQSIEAHEAMNHDIALRNKLRGKSPELVSIYYRLQVPLSQDKSKMDNTEPEVIDYWIGKGKEIVSSPEFKAVVGWLNQDLCRELVYCREENYANREGLHAKMCPQSQVKCTIELKKSLIG